MKDLLCEVLRASQFELVNDQATDSISLVLSVVANDAVKHNLKKIAIKATINTFMEVVKPE